MSEITREELQHEIDVRAEERSEYEGSRQCRRTEELDEQLALYRLAILGLDAQQAEQAFTQMLAKEGEPRYELSREEKLVAAHDLVLSLQQQLRTARSDALEEAFREHVAWCCIKLHDNDQTTIHLCDSDTPGAFKVYRAMIGAGK